MNIYIYVYMYTHTHTHFLKRFSIITESYQPTEKEVREFKKTN